MIFPEQKSVTYICSACGKKWRTTRASMSTSCTVYHSPGTCCHYLEEDATEVRSAAKHRPNAKPKRKLGLS